MQTTFSGSTWSSLFLSFGCVYVGSAISGMKEPNKSGLIRNWLIVMIHKHKRIKAIDGAEKDINSLRVDHIKKKYMLRLNSRFNRRSLDFLLTQTWKVLVGPSCANRPYVHPNDDKGDDHVDPEIVVCISLFKRCQY